jgi:hypothetical protein
MKGLNWVFTLSSINVLLVTVERFSPTTTVVLSPHHFLRLHEILQITTLILFTVVLPIFVLRIVTHNFSALQTGRGFALFVLFIIGVYFYATGNGLHEVSSFNFNQFCFHHLVTTDLCGGFFINDYYTGNVLYFVGGALVVITPMLFETVLPQDTFDRWDMVILVGNACVYAVAIFAYAGFDPVLVGLVYAAVIVVVADVLWLHVRAQYRAHPVITYTAVAYTLGTVAALVTRLH